MDEKGKSIVKQKQICDQMELLNSNLKQLEKACYALKERLISVSQTDPENLSTKEDMPALVPMAEDLRLNSVLIYKITNELQGMARRLEL